MGKLTELAPALEPMGAPDQWGTQYLTFLCPKCQKHRLGVYIWNGPATEQNREYPEFTSHVRVWHAEQGPHHDWDTLTVSPSIAREHCGDPCGGWHGVITDGEVEPGI